MDLIGAGSVLGGLGQLAGGVTNMMSDSGGGAPNYMGRDHRASIRNEMKARLMYARQFGNRFNFHPLTALGINPASGGSFARPTGGRSSKGNAISRMGQGLDRILSAGQSEYQKAQIENLNAKRRQNISEQY